MSNIFLDDISRSAYKNETKLERSNTKTFKENVKPPTKNNFDFDLVRDGYFKNSTSEKYQQLKNNSDTIEDSINKVTSNKVTSNIFNNSIKDYVETKEKFETHNDRIAKLQLEIANLKVKLRDYEEIKSEKAKLKIDNEELKEKLQNYTKGLEDQDKLKTDIISLKTMNSKLQGKILEIDKIKQENILLKQQLHDSEGSDNIKLIEKIEESNESNETNESISEEMNDNIFDKLKEEFKKDNSKNELGESNKLEETNELDYIEEILEKEEEKIKINVTDLKYILSKRLKLYHENHIDNLIKKHNIQDKGYINKSKMTKILYQAIHI